MAETMLVRLKAYNPKKGHVLQRYTVGGVRFQAGRGWYRVDAEMAAYLEAVHQIPDDEDAPLAFDVCTEAEARALDAREARAARQVLPAEEALDVTRHRRMRVADVTRTHRAAVRVPRAVRAAAPPRVRRDAPLQHDAPPRAQDTAGREEERAAAPHAPPAAGDAPAPGPPEDAEDAEDAWEESLDLARDIEDAAEESFDAGLPADPEVPAEEEADGTDDAEETDEVAEDHRSELTTEDLPPPYGRRRRKGKRR